MTVQIVEIGGQRIAMLRAEDYERLVELAEELEDIAALDAAVAAQASGAEYVPSELVHAIASGENALRVWRNYRKMSTADLAAASGVTIELIERIEQGDIPDDAACWADLAHALRIDPDDIAPIDPA